MRAPSITVHVQRTTQELWRKARTGGFDTVALVIAAALSILWLAAPIAFAVGYRRALAPMDSNLFAFGMVALMAFGPLMFVWAAVWFVLEARQKAAASVAGQDATETESAALEELRAAVAALDTRLERLAAMKAAPEPPVVMPMEPPAGGSGGPFLLADQPALRIAPPSGANARDNAPVGWQALAAELRKHGAVAPTNVPPAMANDFSDALVRADNAAIRRLVGRFAKREEGRFTAALSRAPQLGSRGQRFVDDFELRLHATRTPELRSDPASFLQGDEERLYLMVRAALP